jgi:hypothetical protein
MKLFKIMSLTILGIAALYGLPRFLAVSLLLLSGSPMVNSYVVGYWLSMLFIEVLIFVCFTTLLKSVRR